MAAKHTLLTPAQVTQCEAIADTDSNFNKRAKALLAIHGGATHADAATTAELSLSQVKYWLKKFRDHGGDIFPIATLDPATAIDDAESSKADNKKAKKQLVKDKSKDKKKTKDDKKKAKKEKKDKKEKKSKKDKKKLKK